MNSPTSEYLKKIGTVLLTVLMVGSMVGGYAFAGTATAATSATQTEQSSTTSVKSLAETSTETQQEISDGNIQPQISDYPVNVSTTLQDISITDFGYRSTGTGQYNISGALDATPSNPIAPVGHRVSVELFTYSQSGDVVAHDEANINLNPGSAHPYKLNVSGVGVVDLHKSAENNTNPKNMKVKNIDFDSDGTNEYIVVNNDNQAVIKSNGDYIFVNQGDSVKPVRDPYTSEFGFNLELGNAENYDFEIYVTASDGPSDYTGDVNPTDPAINPTESGSILVTDPASTTSISSFFNIQSTTNYREESDVTYATAYKSTRLQEEQEIYEELGLPIRGAYRATQLSPQGTVRSFAEATSTNGQFAKFIPDSNGRFRVTTATQSISTNEPQTLVIRYVAPGDGQFNVIPINSSGVPIKNGRSSDTPVTELGYELPEDPTTKTYTAGANNQTNIAVIQLSHDEQERLNKFGEFFLSYENDGSSSDEFRLYCQAIVTGTINRNTTACGLGLNSAPAEDFNNGVISDFKVYPADTTIFNGVVNSENTEITALNPGVADDSDHVYFEATVKNTGSQPISNEPVDLFEDSDVTFDRQASDGTSTINSYPYTESFTLQDSDGGFAGQSIELTTDLNTGDGTVIVTVSNSAGDSKEFIYDGHRGEISERLDGMARSTTYTVEIETELRTGQRDPEVNSIQLDAEEIGSASDRKQTVSLDPGETQTVRFPTSGDMDPTDFTGSDVQLEYNAHFYDDTKTVTISTDLDSGDCSSGSGDNCDGGVSNEAQAVISGPETLYREVTGTNQYQSGTRTTESIDCPDGSGTGDTCGTTSEWELVEQNVGSVSGTQTQTTQESGVPLQLSLVGSGAYTGDLRPLTEWGSVNNPYRNLPGEDSEWSLDSYGVNGVSSSQERIATKQQIKDEFGYATNEELEKAGWTIQEENVGESIDGYQYAHFRAVNETSSVSYNDDITIDRESDDWQRVTQTEYETGNYSEPLTITEITSVETEISATNPNEDSYADENWVQGERVEYVVNRNYSAGWDEDEFWSDPGGAWEYNDTGDSPADASSGPYRYTKPNIVDEYWVYEWSLEEEREFRLHEKAVSEQEDRWVQNKYNVDVTWSRSLSGTLNEYEGPEFAEETEFGDATGTFTGEDSQAALEEGRIEEYTWTIDGEVVDTGEQTYDFDTGWDTLFTGTASDTYTETVEYDLTNHADESEVRYQPSELTLNLSVDDNNEGAVHITVEQDDLGVSSNHQIDGSDIPTDGYIELNLRDDIGVYNYDRNYTVSVSGSAPTGEDIPEVRDVKLTGEANRGGSSIRLEESTTGSVDIGLTVEDTEGYEDTATKTVDIRECGNIDCPNSITPTLIVSDHSEIADYEAGLANVQAEITGLGYNQDDYYVAELSPGDVSIPASQSVTCQESQTEMTASQIHNQYESWMGLSEDQVVDYNDPYCVLEAENDDGTSTVEVSSTYGGEENVQRIVWEGASTEGGVEEVNFNINPRNNDIITEGSQQFTLRLRKLGGETFQIQEFEIFFCHALNREGDDSRNKIPTDRDTRDEGGYVCPELNSDFDNFNSDVSWDGTTYNAGTPSTDSIDACPYDPGKQEFEIIIGSGDDAQRNCNNNIRANELGVTWETFETPQDASEHAVYYNRYDSVTNDNGADYTIGEPSEEVLQLGYSPYHQSEFDRNNLLAYYPLNEEPIDLEHDGIPVNSSYQPNDLTCQNYPQVQCPEDYDTNTYNLYNISHTVDGGVLANPAWELQQMSRDDLSTYPYENIWLAVDVYGSSCSGSYCGDQPDYYHAPLLHNETREVVEVEEDEGTYSTTYTDIYNDFYRGDELKTPQRGGIGPLDTASVNFGEYAFFTPFDMTGGDDRFETAYDSGNPSGTSSGYSDCSTNDSTSCYYPRYNKYETPMGGDQYNSGLGATLSNTDEFTISMYVKTGPNVGSGVERNNWIVGTRFPERKYFTFYDWNGHQFGTVHSGSSTRHLALYAQTNDLGDVENVMATKQDQISQKNYLRAKHESHAWNQDSDWDALTTMIDETNPQPLQPTYSRRYGGETGLPNMEGNHMATGQSYTAHNAPPEIKSLNVNRYDSIRGINNGPGVGWRHIAVVVEDGESITYYVDGLPYEFDMAEHISNNGGGTTNRGNEFDGLSGTGLFHTVGSGMKKADNKAFLNDYYISDYRIYETAATESEVNEHMLVNDASYTSRTQKISENTEQLQIETESGESIDDAVQTMLDETPIEDASVGWTGSLNNGKVTVTAYPLDADGNRVQSGDLYIRRSYNETQTVGDADPLQFAAISDDSVDPHVLEWEYNNDCPPEKVTCQSRTRVLYAEGAALPTFVATDILTALDNGTITSETAYDAFQLYDDNQLYVVNYRDFWDRPAYYSSGSGYPEAVTLEDFGIDSQFDFEREIEFEKNIDVTTENTYAGSGVDVDDDGDGDGIHDNWEIVVEMESANHTHQTPKIQDAGVYTYENNNIDECSEALYFCTVE